MEPLSLPFGYRPARGIGGVAVAFIWTVTALDLALVLLRLTSGAAVDAINAGEGPSAGGMLAAVGFVGLGLLQLGSYLTAAILFLVWLYRAMTNLRVISDGHFVGPSPGWAVGSFFVPFANLVVPYTAVGAAWDASHVLAGEEPTLRPPRPWFVGAWWAAWLAGNVLSWISTFTDGNRLTPGVANVLAPLMHLPAAWLVTRIIRGINAAQDDRARRMATERLPQPEGLTPLIP